MLIIGGWHTESFTDQISEVTECSLSRIGTLPFNAFYPACNTYTMTRRVWICFYDGARDGCKSFDGKTILEEPSANYDHGFTSLGIYDGSPFALGDGMSENKEVEKFKSSWTSIGQFPFVFEWIAWYSTVNLDNVLFIFGGVTGVTDNLSRSLDLVAQYDGNWKLVGRLLQRRSGHRSIIQGNKIIHIGGQQLNKANMRMFFEEWTVGEDRIQKTKHYEWLQDYDDYPESFWIPSDFCA
jgi:hypothetical protein